MQILKQIITILFKFIAHKNLTYAKRIEHKHLIKAEKDSTKHLSNTVSSFHNRSKHYGLVYEAQNI